uniref:Uncharacterized protein n=1 Tax=Arundo donax TaxID=35708 RepID=A0A0A9GDA3_ARUDO
MVERLATHSVSEFPILQPINCSAVGSWDCITRHVLKP